MNHHIVLAPAALLAGMFFTSTEAKAHEPLVQVAVAVPGIGIVIGTPAPAPAADVVYVYEEPRVVYRDVYRDVYHQPVSYRPRERVVVVERDDHRGCRHHDNGHHYGHQKQKQKHQRRH
jgi:hypothetical protein